MKPQDPVKIARIGLVLEMADGSKVMVYADHLRVGEVVIKTEDKIPATPWDYGRRNGPPETSITITGLEAYRIQFTEPGVRVSSAGRALETFRREVRP